MTDYKNTPEGKIVAQKYADILPLSRPEPSYKHPRMTLSNRAKIFSPVCGTARIRGRNRSGRRKSPQGYKDRIV